MLIMTKEIDTWVLYHTNSVIGRRQTPTEPAAADITGTAPGPAPSQLKQVCVCVCVCIAIRAGRRANGVWFFLF
jgi:hypothetical protein